VKHYLLDSHIWIYAMNGRHPAVRKQLESLALDRVHLSDIVLGELAFGWENSVRPNETKHSVEHFLERFPRLSTDVATARCYGQLRQNLQSRGTPIDMNDFWIAAQALTHKMILVTKNTREFARIPGLKLDNWTDSPKG
jgi:tRNA(fMet)-specific endonuclease VapC